MKLEHKLTQKLEQKLHLSLKVQHVLKLLQLNSLELMTELREIVDGNPLLELEGEDYKLIDEDNIETPEEENYESKSDTPYFPKHYNPDFDGWDFERLEGPQPSFEEMLRNFAFYILEDDEFKIFEILMDNMNEFGLLKRPIEEISREVAVNERNIRRVIKKLRDSGFDGLFAENLEELKELGEEIVLPSSGYNDGNPIVYIEPELYIDFVDNRFIVTAKDYGLAIRVDEVYRELLKNGKDEAGKFLKKKFQEAEFYVNALEKRRSTLITIGEELVRTNPDFLLGYSKTLRPLKMTDIAEKLDVVVSTISRAVKGKFVQTPIGTFPLRYFFGSEQSREQAMEIIAELLKENPKLSDSAIAKKLNERGIKIARRTVNKYRNVLLKKGDL